MANGSNSVSVLFQAELRVLASGGQILSGPPLASAIVTQTISTSSVTAGGSGLRSVATAPENRCACEAECGAAHNYHYKSHFLQGLRDIEVTSRTSLTPSQYI